MSDIFISYSRKDSPQALSLAEQLRAEGMSVWIDQHGIAGAEQWAAEIVEGIQGCSTFLLLLSQDSTDSDQVLKEVALASEKRKRILPVDLHPTELPAAFQYPLAGLQRVPYADLAKILRAHRTGIERTVAIDHRKSLIVLPFEDLSPQGEDNAWFADGLAGELIDALGHIKSLRILDRKTSIGIRGSRLRTVEIAREFDTRYFIEGSVRKFGEQIKISVALLDIESGDYLWQESHRGEFKDIFDIQEAVAERVVRGLQLHLTPQEKSSVDDRGTQNAEAYQLYVRAMEYFRRQSKEGFTFCVELLSEAIRLDPRYARAYQFKSNTLTSIYRLFDRNPALLQEAESLCHEALLFDPELFSVYYPLSQVYRHLGNSAKAEAMALEYVRRAPNTYSSYFSLGFYYAESLQPAKAIPAYEEALRLNPGYLTTLHNLVSACRDAGEIEKSAAWARFAIPAATRELTLHPDDENAGVSLALLLHWSGEDTRSLATIRKLKLPRDGRTIFNIAALLCSLGEKQEALLMLEKSLDAGFRHIQLVTAFFTAEQGLGSLAGTAEYERLKQKLAALETEVTSG